MPEQKKDDTTKKNDSMLGDLTTWAINEYIKPRMKDMAHTAIKSATSMIGDALLAMFDRKFSVNAPSNTTTDYHTASTNGGTPLQRIENSGVERVNRFISRGPYETRRNVPDKGSADLIKDRMIRLIDVNGKARVGDLYEQLGIETTSTDWVYGWTRVSDIHYIFQGGVYVFDFPTPVRVI